MRSWMRSSTAKRTAWILMAAFVWTAVGPQPARAAVEYCKELRAAALPQAIDIRDADMAKIAGGCPPPPPPPPPPPCTSCYCSGGPTGPTGPTGPRGCPMCARVSVNTTNGSMGFSARATDPPSGRGSIEVDVYYGSQEKNDGPLGKAWSHSFNITLTQDPEAGVNVRILSPNGNRLDFTGDNADWKTSTTASFTAKGGANSKLEKSGGVYKLWAGDSVMLQSLGKTQHIFGPVSSNVAKLGKIFVDNDTGTSDDDYVSSLEYNASGISGVVDGAGNRATVVYVTGSNRISYLQYTGDVRTTFTYAANGGYYDLASIERPTEAGQPGSFSTYTYDSGHKMTTVTEGGGTATYVYSGASSSDRVTVIIDPLGFRTTYTYAPSDLTVAVQTAVRTDPTGNKTTFENNHTASSSLPLYKVDQVGDRSSYTYDAAGRIKTVAYKIDGQLCTNTYSYDATTGNVSSEWFQPAGTTVNYAYYSDGDLKTITDELGAVTTYTYDNRRVKTVEDPLHDITTFVYGTTAPGHIRIETTGDAGVCSIAYTYWTTGGGAGNVKTIDDGGVTTYCYDDLGRTTVIQKSPSSGTAYTATLDYDNWGRRRHVTLPDLTTVDYNYDCCHLTSMSDPNGKLTSYGYYADGSLMVTTDAAGQATATSFGYDSVNHKSWRSFTDAEGKTATYTYDARGLLEKVQYADSTSENYTYEESGNVKSMTALDGGKTTYSYDTRGRLTKIDYPNDTDTLFSYNAAGRVTGMSDASGATSYSYYDDGTLKATSVTFTGSGFGTKIVTYGYYADGARKSITLPGGGITTYHYDASGRLSWLVNSNSEETTYTYDGMGRIVKRSLDNAAYTSYNYNNRSWITDVENIKRDGSTVLSSFSYYYSDATSTDYVGNILRIGMRLSDGNTYNASFTYDEVYRLTYEGRSGPSAYGYAYTYDKMGNRKTLAVSADGRTTYSYDLDSNSELDSQDSGSGTISYTYDSRGNTTKKAVSGDGTTTYTYSDNDMLTKAQYDGSTSSTYSYNGLGARVKKVATNGTPTYFIYDGADAIMELDSGGSSVAEYSYGIDGLISQRRSGTSYYAACDRLGSVWNLVTLDASETISASYTYTAFGDTTTIGADNTGNPYKYVGRLGYYADSENGLMLLGARYYNSGIGRFSTLDPIGDGRNWYGYVENRPCIDVDPTGLFGYTDCVSKCFNTLAPGLIETLAVNAVSGVGTYLESKSKSYECKAPKPTQVTTITRSSKWAAKTVKVVGVVTAVDNAWSLGIGAGCVSSCAFEDYRFFWEHYKPGDFLRAVRQPRRPLQTSSGGYGGAFVY